MHRREDHVSVPAKVIGSGSAGVLELFLFHPVDTAAKRLMYNQQPIFAGVGFAEGKQNLYTTIFREHSHSDQLRKYLSLFPGISYGLMFKVFQRIYRFGGQCTVRDYIQAKWLPDIRNTVSDKYAKSIVEATAGSLIGIGEVILLPLDNLKIKAQTNPETIQGRSIFQIISQHGIRPFYRGALVTAIRNAPCSFVLFGSACMVRERVYGIHNAKDATMSQHFIASSAGSVASIILASPFDVVKTRIQSKPFYEATTSGWRFAKSLYLEEGIGAFFKGLTPKVITTTPKLCFSYTIAQYFMTRFDDLFVDKIRTVEFKA